MAYKPANKDAASHVRAVCFLQYHIRQKYLSFKRWRAADRAKVPIYCLKNKKLCLRFNARKWARIALNDAKSLRDALNFIKRRCGEIPYLATI